MTEQVTAVAEGNELTATIAIAAPAARVWALVADVERMSEWSPQVVKTVAFGKPLRLGTRFVNLNHQGWKHWPTTARVVRYTPEREIAFRVTENRTVWSFRLEEAGGRTLLTHRREAPDGISAVSGVLVKYALGGKDDFERSMRDGMGQTLTRIKAELEA